MKFAFPAFLIAMVLLATQLWNSNQDTVPQMEPHEAQQNSAKLEANTLDTKVEKKNATPTAQTKHELPANLVKISEITVSPIDQIRAIQDKTDFQESLIKEHDDFKRYPSFNRAFQDAQKDPVLARYEAFERTTESDDNKTALTIWSDQKYYLPGETSQVFATLRDANGALINTSFAGQLIFNETENMGPIEFTLSNQVGKAKIPLPVDYPAGIYKVLIANQINEVADALTFTLSKPEARLTGEFKDQINDQGGLNISAQIEVSKANRYYLEASLYSSTNDAIGTSQTSINLTPGKHWMSLDFHGLMIRDAGEPGPYVLKNISLAKVAMPIQRTPLDSLSHETQGYVLEQFSNRTHAEQEQDGLQDQLAASSN